MARAPQLGDYTIILFCPLVVEQKAACLMLDEVHDGVPERSAGQTVIYTLGRIASYNVAIAGYPTGEAGVGVSGSMVSEALRDFPNLEAGLLVGIAAGIPSPTRDIRLGDVAVAVPNGDNPGVIGYDLVKVEEGEVRLKQWQNSTHSLLRSAITSIQVHQGRSGPGFVRHLHVLDTAAEFRRPTLSPPSSEFLASGTQPDVRDEPQVHYGTILSGNGVIKSKERRDELRDRFGGIAIEMEAAGMMTRLPVAVVRGISDFADAYKNDDWQPYAAVTAASYAKEIITRLGPRREPEPEARSVISSDAEIALTLSLPEQRHFVGRQTELSQLESWLGFHHQKPPQRSTVAVWGLSGVGKSQLVSEYVRRQRENHPTRDIFWISGETKEAFEQSIMGFLKVAHGPESRSSESGGNYDEHRTVLINSFFKELGGSWRTKWLLVIDGIPGASVLHQHIRRCIDGLPHGSIILITRGKEVASYYHRRIEVKGLPEMDAAKLLRREIDEHLVGADDDTLQLCSMLKYHPLSLTLAASVISNYPLTVADYAQEWLKRKLDAEIITADRALLHSFELSFEELEHTSPLSAQLLMLFGFLDHRDMWYDLCLNATDEDYPAWVRQVATRYRFQEFYAPLRNLSFVEGKPRGQGRGIMYEIHPAIHEFARWKAKERGSEAEYIRCAVSLVAAKVPRSNDEDFLAIAQRLEPHADQCKIYMEQDRMGAGLDLVELEKFGNLFRHLGRHDEASKLYQGILSLLEEEEHPCPLDLELMAGIENNLGLVYHAQRNYGLAMQAYDRSIHRMLQNTVEDKGATMVTIHNQGRTLMMLGRLDESLQSLELAAGYFDRSTQEDDEGSDQLLLEERGRIYFRILNDIGEICLRMNNVEEAENSFRAAFDGLKQYLYPRHPAAFAVRLNLGRVCVEQHRFSTAKKIFEYIIETYMGWWGGRHSETMRAVAELADAHMRHGEMKRLMGDGGDVELELAAQLWSEVLDFHQEVYGTGSDTAAMASSKLQRLRLLLSEATSEDPYSMYCA